MSLEVLQRFARCYRADFAYLGYSADPRLPGGLAPAADGARTVSLAALRADEALTAQQRFLKSQGNLWR